MPKACIGEHPRHFVCVRLSGFHRWLARKIAVQIPNLIAGNGQRKVGVEILESTVKPPKFCRFHPTPPSEPPRYRTLSYHANLRRNVGCGGQN